MHLCHQSAPAACIYDAVKEQSTLASSYAADRLSTGIAASRECAVLAELLVDNLADARAKPGTDTNQ